MKHILLCFLILITGFDLAAINLPIGSFRLSIVIFFAAFLYLFLFRRGRVDVKLLLVFLTLTVLMLSSSFFSTNPLRSFSYIIWLLLSFFLIFLSFKELLVEFFTYDDLVLAVRDTGRLQIIFCFLLSLVGVERPSLLYYEPSYLVIALLPYVYFSLSNFSINRNKWFGYVDVLLIFILLKVTMSANLILAMSMCLLFIYVRVNFKALIYISIFICIGYFSASWYGDNYNDLLAVTINKIFKSADVVASILERSGNRWPRMQIGLDVSADYLYQGVGLGTFSEFSLTYNTLRDYANGFSWNEPRGFPATNIFVEVLAESGLFVLMGLIVFFLAILGKSPAYLRADSALRDWRLINVIVILLLMIESSILRPYFWFFLAVLASLTSSRREQDQ